MLLQVLNARTPFKAPQALVVKTQVQTPGGGFTTSRTYSMTGDPPSEFGVALEMEGGVMSHPDHVLGFVALPARHAIIGGHDVTGLLVCYNHSSCCLQWTTDLYSVLSTIYFGVRAVIFQIVFIFLLS